MTILGTARSPNQGQLDRLSQLYRLVARIADGLGSENTDSGQVLPVSQATFKAARLAVFPSSYLSVRLTAARFQADFGDISGVSELLSFAAPYRPEFCFAGAPERFHPNAPDRGNFWVCLFLRSRRGLGQNILVRFERTET